MQGEPANQSTSIFSLPNYKNTVTYKSQFLVSQEIGYLVTQAPPDGKFPMTLLYIGATCLSLHPALPLATTQLRACDWHLAGLGAPGMEAESCQFASLGHAEIPCVQMECLRRTGIGTKGSDLVSVLPSHHS